MGFKIVRKGHNEKPITYYRNNQTMLSQLKFKTIWSGRKAVPSPIQVMKHMTCPRSHSKEAGSGAVSHSLNT